MAMRKSVRLLLSVLIALLCCQLNASAQKRVAQKELLKQLLYYWNSNLECLDQKETRKVESLVSQLVPERKNPDNSPGYKSWRPWFVFAIDQSNDHEIYIVMDTQTVFTIPGEARTRMHFLDDEGKHLASTEFPMGWRTLPKDVRFLPHNNTGSPLIEISVQRTGTWEGLAREYYAFKGTTVTLVRLETAEGEIVRNSYTDSVASLGTPVPPRSADEWKAALASDNNVETLQALMWLSGTHEDPDELEEDEAQAGAADASSAPAENFADAKHAESLRSRADVLKLVRELTKSPNRWIREAAELVLKPVTDDE